MAKSLQQQLTDLSKDNKKILQLKTENGDTIEKVLKSQAELFIKIIKEEINRAVYSKPEGWYKRSHDLENSINENIFINPKTNTITIGFLEDKAWHDSWITKKGNTNYSKHAYIPQGIREGYEVFNTGYHVEGIDYIQNAIDRFNKIKNHGLQ